ncbi:MAG: winged helix-turn-helix domain-containing protein [Acidobacteriaceae bacterium]
MPDDHFFVIGRFTVDLLSHQVRCNGSRVLVQEQPLLVLAELLKRAGQLVTREELHLKLWCKHPEVDFEHSLNKVIHKLRAAFADDPDNPAYIETISRRGYRFIAPVLSSHRNLNEVHAARHNIRIAVFPFYGVGNNCLELRDGLYQEVIAQLGSCFEQGITTIALANEHPPSSEDERYVLARSLDLDYWCLGRLHKRDVGFRFTFMLVELNTRSIVWVKKFIHDSEAIDAGPDFHVRTAEEICREVTERIVPGARPGMLQRSMSAAV